MKYQVTPSSIFIFISSSSTREPSALSQSEARFTKLGEYSHMLSEAFWTLNITQQISQLFAEPFSGSTNTPNYVREAMFAPLRMGFRVGQ